MYLVANHFKISWTKRPNSRSIKEVTVTKTTFSPNLDFSKSPPSLISIARPFLRRLKQELDSKLYKDGIDVDNLTKFLRSQQLLPSLEQFDLMLGISTLEDCSTFNQVLRIKFSIDSVWEIGTVLNGPDWEEKMTGRKKCLVVFIRRYVSGV